MWPRMHTVHGGMEAVLVPSNMQNHGAPFITIDKIRHFFHLIVKLLSQYPDPLRLFHFDVDLHVYTCIVTGQE